MKIGSVLAFAFLMMAPVVAAEKALPEILLEYVASTQHDKGNCQTSGTSKKTMCSWLAKDDLARIGASSFTVLRKPDPAPGLVWHAQIHGPTKSLSEYVGTTKLRVLGKGGAQTFYRVEDGPIAPALVSEMRDNHGPIYQIWTDRYAAGEPSKMKWLLK